MFELIYFLVLLLGASAPVADMSPYHSPGG